MLSVSPGLYGVYVSQRSSILKVCIQQCGAKAEAVYMCVILTSLNVSCMSGISRDCPWQYWTCTMSCILQPTVS